MPYWIDNMPRQSYINNPRVINTMPSSSPPSTNTPDSRSKRTRRKGARPGELLAAALDLFVEKGFAATRVEEIAQHAGVSKGTLFLYFPSKEDLFKAVVRENISVRFSEWDEEINRFTGPTSDMLHVCLFGWWERIGSTKASGISKLMMSEAQNFPDLADFYQREVIRPGNALIERILRRGIARGEFRPMDVTCGVFLVLAPMLFLAMWKHSLGNCCGGAIELDPQKYLAAQLDMLLRGFGTSPSSSRPKARPNMKARTK
jgi:AcrR family transcriptional regulator